MSYRCRGANFESFSCYWPLFLWLGNLSFSPSQVEAFPAWKIEVEGGSAALRKSYLIPTSPEELPKSFLLRRKRYAINPLLHKWDHFNITYKIEKFPSTLNKADTRKAIAIAFVMWSDVSPLTFTELPTHKDADITIGFYTFNHTDCWFAPLHPCFDGLNGELAHAFLPPLGKIHFDNHEFWILGKSRFSWKQGCIDKKRLCDPWARVGFCEQRRSFMKRHCPKVCDLCFEPPDAVPTTTALPQNIKMKYVSKGRIVTFRCGQAVSRLSSHKVSWYKDGELLADSVPGYFMVKGQGLSIVANEYNEGLYTCQVQRKTKTIQANSWWIRVKDDNNSDDPQNTNSHRGHGIPDQPNPL
ncbi:matrix metallopeptidase 23bb isoform X2 [Leucoraja erinacea]|uniref:matrix metallopeptidase 23bb isoform X2 n=1 Tax=Leucoraja erinaceus TaxID=7782 RepID=UPI00245644C4|nr:matrix metallopeptidase 23bb isoform X2 [Leucoraja erinacea]